MAIRRYHPLDDKQRKYLKLGPRVEVPSVETRQSINKELRRQRKLARSHRKRIEAAQTAPRSDIVRPKWAKALLTAPFNKRSRKARRQR